MYTLIIELIFFVVGTSVTLIAMSFAWSLMQKAMRYEGKWYFPFLMFPAALLVMAPIVIYTVALWHLVMWLEGSVYR